MRNHLNLAVAIEHHKLSGINSISNFRSLLQTLIVFRLFPAVGWPSDCQMSASYCNVF
jgi:hypothetical protein